MKKPKLVKDGSCTYAVIGKSGERAGHIQQMMPRGRGWLVSLFSTPDQVYFTFKSAKADALEMAERY
ncbi:MAG: hypothetical protein WC026_17185 [Hyphomicrobium sp.]|uniref:hypothetical protein n=1 Tax=Hyphomicrobium sp. TaxID=82 RepID=UPI003569D8B8